MEQTRLSKLKNDKPNEARMKCFILPVHVYPEDRTQPTVL